MLRNLVRGYVLNEMMHTLIGVESYDDPFNCAIRVFVTGLPALAVPMDGQRAASAGFYGRRVR
jgi:hypothetical protein